MSVITEGDIEDAMDELVWEYGSYQDKISSCVRNHQPYANQDPSKYEAARKEVIRLFNNVCDSTVQDVIANDTATAFGENE